jgi:hypothetical protein
MYTIRSNNLINVIIYNIFQPIQLEYSTNITRTDILISYDDILNFLAQIMPLIRFRSTKYATHQVKHKMEW